MNDIPTKDTFINAYADKAPWDIGGPQPAFVEAADQITGSILDAGCGTGENALFFAERGNRTTGVDFLEEPIRRAKQKASERGVAVDFRVADALALGVLSQVFDNVIDCGLFHVFGDDDRKRYVEALAGVIKPDDRVFLMCFSDEEPGTAGPRRVSQDDLHSAFADGWAVESITASRFQTIAEFEETFSKGGPKAWFVVVRRL